MSCIVIVASVIYAMSPSTVVLYVLYVNRLSKSEFIANYSEQGLKYITNEDHI